MADGGPDAVRTRVAAADDEDALAFRRNGGRGEFAAEIAVLSAQELEREVHALQVASRDLQVARGGGADRDDDGVEHAREVVRRDVDADVRARHEADAFRLQQLAAAGDERLVELEVRDAVAQESADVGVLFVDGDRPAFAAQGARGGESGRTGADDGGALAVLFFGRLGHDPAPLESGVDDELLALADHDRLLVEVAHTARFAQGRTDPRGEFREVAVDAQEFVGAADVAFGHGAVFVRHEIAEGAAGAVAEGHAAVLAAFQLGFDVLERQAAFDFLEVVLALVHGTVDVVNAFHNQFSFTGTTLTKRGR